MTKDEREAFLAGLHVGVIGLNVEGPVTSIEECSDDARRDMAYRYLGPEIGDAYLASTASDQSGDRTYEMSPERWYTVDDGKDLAG